MKMKIVLRRVCDHSPIDGRRLKRKVWGWRVMKGKELLHGGYATTKRDALNNARIVMTENKTDDVCASLRAHNRPADGWNSLENQK